jgi:hypothetical protein
LTYSSHFVKVFENPTRRLIMAKKLYPAKLVSFKELLITNFIQINVLLPAIDRERTDLSRGIFSNWYT